MTEIKQRGSHIRNGVGLFSPYYDTIAELLYYEAFDGGRVGQDAFHPLSNGSGYKNKERVSKLRVRHRRLGKKMFLVWIAPRHGTRLGQRVLLLRQSQGRPAEIC